MTHALSIALGGAIGVLGRHFVSVFVARSMGGTFPWATLAVNVVGSLVLGILVGVMAQAWNPSPAARAFLVIGLLGGFTTFSAFSLDVVLLAERDGFGLACFYAAVSVVASVAGLFGGMRSASYFLG